MDGSLTLSNSFPGKKPTQPMLASLVGNPEHFMKSFWQHRPGVFAAQVDASKLLDLKEVERMLAGRALRYPYLELTKVGLDIPPASYYHRHNVYGEHRLTLPDVESVSSLIYQGATLLLRFVEQWHRPTDSLVRQLSSELERPVEAFYFLTPAGAQGLPDHRDEADVFVLQVGGVKQWRIFGPPTDAHWKAGAEVSAGEALLEAELRAGEVLYIPRGFAHSARVQDSRSQHLSFTVRDVTKMDLYKELLRQIGVGTRLPEFPLNDEDAERIASQIVSRAAKHIQAMTPSALLDAARHAVTPRHWEDGSLAAMLEDFS
jgi:ribosomal protein L16 Arg81 hydroxylase